MISVVLSFYNEGGILPELIRRLRNVFQVELEKKAIRSYELIFVNDDSTDRSLEILLEESKRETISSLSICPEILACPNAS